MQFAVSKGEASVAELATRLFDIKGRGAAETMKRTEAALLAANPHLADLTKIPAGTIVVIPDLPGTPAVRAPQLAGLSPELDDQVKIAVRVSGEIVGRSAGVREAALNTTLEALKDRDLKDLAVQAPEIKAQLDKLAEVSRAELKESKAASAAAKDAIAQLEQALGKLTL